VLRAALAILDQHGLSRLSLRGLASRLGVTPMSLYNHFAGKDELFDALHEAVLLDVVLPAPSRRTSWKDLARRMARALRKALRGHPHALPLFATRPVRAPPILREADVLLERLLAAGFSARRALFLLDSVAMFTIGHALAEFGLSPAAAPERDGRDLLVQRRELLQTGLRSLVRVIDETAPHDYDAEFEWGISALLEGTGARS
jgi:TetR/AcrR family tetracycline transcriptional repressor